MTHTLSQWLARARQLIEPIDANVLLCYVLGCRPVYLIMNPDQALTSAQYEVLNDLLQQRGRGYPIAYIVGHKEFWSLDLKITPDVLIPRPATECLVETALKHCPERAQILELATGSGAVACAIAHDRPDVTILASDNSMAALAVAAENIARYTSENVNLVHSHWFDNIPRRSFDMILANPPYVSKTDPHLFDEIRFEPQQALVAEQEGLADLYHIITHAPDYLAPEGILLLEHGYDQGPAVSDTMRGAGYHDVTVVRDLSGHDRVTLGWI